MSYTTREAAIEDADAIAHVHVESWRSTYAGIIPDAFLASLNPAERAERWRSAFATSNFRIFVAEDDGRVVGFVSGGRLREPLETYDAELYAIYLLRDHQGSGLGRALVLMLVNALRSEGLRSMVVKVLEKNPAVLFYRRLGAQLVARELIEIGGARLDELVLGWIELDTLSV
ncbi:MAG TPA: GNAT family N-acetyltransferase [Candidatus Sulfopaludibacter sp.]|nr:GNAT family N-acetyltransferase [Candidatus Sulfopaludibacter sp.]